MTITADTLIDAAGGPPAMAPPDPGRQAVYEAVRHAPEFRPAVVALAAAVNALVVQMAEQALAEQRRRDEIVRMMAADPGPLPPGFRP